MGISSGFVNALFILAEIDCMPGTNKSPEMKFTALEIEDVYRAQVAFFKTGVTRPYVFRKAQLNVLKQALVRNENDLMSALKSDLGKSAFKLLLPRSGRYMVRSILHSNI